MRDLGPLPMERSMSPEWEHGVLNTGQPGKAQRTSNRLCRGGMWDPAAAGNNADWKKRTKQHVHVEYNSGIKKGGVLVR